MNTSERFQRFAAECEFMAKLTASPENQMVGVEWQSDGFNVLNCMDGNNPQFALLAQRSAIGNPAHNWAH